MSRKYKYDVNSPDPCGIIGKTFGKLEVIGYDGHYKLDKPNATMQYWYKVRCGCRLHTEKLVPFSELRSGNTTSCGKCKFSEPILPGDKYGELTVIKMLDTNTSSGHRGVLCECSCEGHPRVVVDRVRLTSGITTCCGGGWHYRKDEYTGSIKLGMLPGTYIEVLKISEAERTKSGDRTALCKCHYVNPVTGKECGKRFNATLSNLATGNTKSCGCTHNIYPSKEARVLGEKWFGMYARCEVPGSQSYDNYGGRGIRLCEEWRNGEEGRYAFIRDGLKRGFKLGDSIDRIDNDKGYSPDNIRYVSMLVQGNNKRSNHRITVGGVTRTIAEWAREIHVDPDFLTNKLRCVTDDREYMRRVLNGTVIVTDRPPADLRNVRKARSDKGKHGLTKHELTVDGVTLRYTQWTDKLGMTDTYLHCYVTRNGESAAAQLVHDLHLGQITINGTTKTFKEWEDLYHTPRGFCFKMYRKHNNNYDAIADELKYWQQTRQMPLS